MTSWTLLQKAADPNRNAAERNEGWETLEGTAPPVLPELCRKYGISSPGKASNMIVTVKRRLQKIGMRRLGNRTDSPEGWREE
jgi:hypothetical protein